MADTDVAKARTAPTETPPKAGNPAWELMVRNQSIVVPIVALLLAFAIGAILIRGQGVNPAYAYESLFRAALGTPEGLLRTLQKTTPLILTGLAVSVAFRVGLFNIGAQGQLLCGAMGAAWVGFSMKDLPGIILIPLATVVGVLLGAMWASLAAFLKTSRGVHEVISTIMLNSIAVGIMDTLVNYPFKEPGQPIARTPEIGAGAKLPDLGIVPLGFIIALLLALFSAWMLKRTTTGFKFDTVGKNKHAAGYAGIGIAATTIYAMALSGGMAGLAGVVETLGVVHRYESGFNAGLGFDGITIALLARANPMGTIPAAFLVGILRSGAASLQFDTGIQPEIVDLLLAVTLLLVSIPILAKLIFRKRAAQQAALSSGWGS
ncbi:MAG: ABC transporter permease [Dermatophilaceae bacterium]|jgi:simple sugar transport system permease protein|nr:ABC transporter permease [Dermatophilaceae bacterium]